MNLNFEKEFESIFSWNDYTLTFLGKTLNSLKWMLNYISHGHLLLILKDCFLALIGMQ